MPRKTDVEEGAEAVEEKAPKNKKAPKPDGYVSPVEFAKFYSADKAGVAVDDLTEGQAIRPQIIYGYIKNSEGFRALVETNVDGKLMINVEAGLAFLRSRDATKAAAKAAKEAAKADEEE